MVQKTILESWVDPRRWHVLLAYMNKQAGEEKTNKALLLALAKVTRTLVKNLRTKPVARGNANSILWSSFSKNWIRTQIQG